MKALQPLRALKRVQTPQWGNMSSANRIINKITGDSYSMNKTKLKKCIICNKEYDVYTAPYVLNPNRERMRIWDTCSVGCFYEMNRRNDEYYDKHPEEVLQMNKEMERKLHKV
jgi:hypothetical protein